MKAITRFLVIAPLFVPLLSAAQINVRIPTPPKLPPRPAITLPTAVQICPTLTQKNYVRPTALDPKWYLEWRDPASDTVVRSPLSRPYEAPINAPYFSVARISFTSQGTFGISCQYDFAYGDRYEPESGYAALYMPPSLYPQLRPEYFPDWRDAHESTYTGGGYSSGKYCSSSFPRGCKALIPPAKN